MTDKYDYIAILEALSEHKTTRKAAESLGMKKSTYHDALVKAREYVFREEKMGEPLVYHPSDKTQRFILTSAQDETKVHESFLLNLEAYADFIGAELLISGFTYNKKLFESHEKHNATYHTLIQPYLFNDRIHIGDNLSFCGEMNILPTAVRPLSGMDTYTQEKDGIFPHAKVALSSVPTMKGRDAKFNMTTGTVTVPNYVQKKSGQKAEFHHVYGAMLVELTSDGTHYCRHLLGDEQDGSFYDLVYYISEGIVRNEQGDTVTALNYGDVHTEKIDMEAANVSFGPDDSLLNILQPEYQFLHDVTDGTARNHHNIGDPHFMFKMHVNGTESVEDDMRLTYDLLSIIQRPYTKTVIVESNHHTVLERWLKNSDYRKDPINAMFFLKCQYKVYESIKDGLIDFDIYEWALKSCFGNEIDDVEFIREDGSFTLHGIEFGIHGHHGANGARGSVPSFTKVCSKINMGHTHSASIMDGVYCAGVIGSLDMDYNKGPSSWSHSNIVTYKSGKRTILTLRNGRFFAPLDS